MITVAHFLKKLWSLNGTLVGEGIYYEIEMVESCLV